MVRVGVIGAGLSGLLCAQRLLSQMPAAHVTVLEWGRGPGGRTARRRVVLTDGTEISFDHAAPCFSAKSSELKALLQEWAASGHAALWSEAGEDVWVGQPSNHAICRMLAEQVDSAGGLLLYGHHVLAARHEAATGEWTIDVSDRANGGEKEHLVFDSLVFSDKLLLLPNPYAVLAPKEWGPLALPATLGSTGAVVLMLALERAPQATSPPLLSAADLF
ncbi:hypothetical protein T492DRAFT_538322 [Pavlovales sp. CCMP2436]|nr:hypothetical protein T492DRAFT_538322 [Pavlovales sp. CCMP2436]